MFKVMFSRKIPKLASVKFPARLGLTGALEALRIEKITAILHRQSHPFRGLQSFGRSNNADKNHKLRTPHLPYAPGPGGVFVGKEKHFLQFSLGSV
jgi:hypothetical protein